MNALYLTDHSQFGLDWLEEALAGMPQKVKYATATALNLIGEKAKKDLTTSLPSYFDRPTRWTMQAVRLTKANASGRRGQSYPEATVWLKDEAPKGTPAVRYLFPEVAGGNRVSKRFERAIARRLGLPLTSTYFTPAYGVKLDSYGNVPGSYIVKLLSALSAFNEQGFTANQRSSKGKALRADSLFLLEAQQGRPAALAQHNPRDHDDVKILFNIHSKAPSYRKRWPFAQLAIASVRASHDAAFAFAFQQEVEQAIARGKGHLLGY